MNSDSTAANEYLMLMAQIEKSLYKHLETDIGTRFKICENTMPINNRILALFNQIFRVQSLMFIQSGAAVPSAPISLLQP